MKITDLKCYLVEIDWDDRPGANHPRNLIKREFVFVQIDTDEGITGWGEILTIQATLEIGPFRNMSQK